MKLPSTKKAFPKKALIITIAAVVVAGGVGAYFLLNRPANKDATPTTTTQTADQPQQQNINYGPATPEEQKEGSDIKKNTIDQSQNPTQTPATPPTVTITRAGQLQPGQPLNIRTIVQGTTSGTCAVTLTQAGQATVTKSFPIAFQATSSNCNGDIAASDFAAGGQWQLSITATNASGTSSAAVTQTISITK